MNNKDDRSIDALATSLKNMMMNKSYEKTVKPLKNFVENHNTKKKEGVKMTITKEEAIKTLEKSMKCHDRKVCGITEDCEECPLYADKDAEYEAHKVLLEHFKQEDCENLRSDDMTNEDKWVNLAEELIDKDNVFGDKTMQIVIDIPESILNTIQADEMISREQLAVLQMHILNGTPLPKGHGRLIDADALIKSGCYWETEYEMTNAQTIIDADKEVQ